MFVLLSMLLFLLCILLSVYIVSLSHERYGWLVSAGSALFCVVWVMLYTWISINGYAHSSSAPMNSIQSFQGLVAQLLYVELKEMFMTIVLLIVCYVLGNSAENNTLECMHDSNS